MTKRRNILKVSLLTIVISVSLPLFPNPVELERVVPSGNNKFPHVPPLTPSLYIEDGTLSFSTSCLGYTLELVRDGEVEFTYIITTTDDLVLPSTLSGEYQLLLVGPSFTFEGIVEL